MHNIPSGRATCWGQLHRLDVWYASVAICGATIPAPIPVPAPIPSLLPLAVNVHSLLLSPHAKQYFSITKQWTGCITPLLLRLPSLAATQLRGQVTPLTCGVPVSVETFAFSTWLFMLARCSISRQSDSRPFLGLLIVQCSENFGCLLLN